MHSTDAASVTSADYQMRDVYLKALLLNENSKGYVTVRLNLLNYAKAILRNSSKLSKIDVLSWMNDCYRMMT